MEPSNSLKKIIQLIDSQKWNEARQMWIVNVMKYNKNPINNSISLFGSEYEMFIKYIISFQQHHLIQICSNTCSKTNKIISMDREILIFKKINNEIRLHTFHTHICKTCKTEIIPKLEFINNPNFLIIESPGNTFINEIPQLVKNDDKIYRWFCTTLNKRNHFIGVFELENQKYVIDDLKKNATLLSQPNSNPQVDYFDMPTGFSLYYLE